MAVNFMAVTFRCKRLGRHESLEAQGFDSPQLVYGKTIIADCLVAF